MNAVQMLRTEGAQVDGRFSIVTLVNFSFCNNLQALPC